MPSRKKKPTPSHDSNRQSCPVPQGILIAVGGHENKGEAPEKGSNQDQNRNFVPDGILTRFVEELSGNDPLIVVIPTASSVPEEAAGDYHEVFGRLGVKRVETLDIRERGHANDEKALELINEAAGFWFTGGDQLRLTALLGGTQLLQRLKERYTFERIVIGGTSAGASAMSTPMIYEGRNDAGMRKGEIAITTGLQFMHDVAIDTHFIARGRIARMAQIIATNPTCLGLGLEEDTGVVVREGYKLEVIGSGLVTILEGNSCTATNIYDISPNTPFSIRDLVLHFLGAGEEYELPMPPELHL
ncbi:cyanophycinase [Hymenobacter cellulosilyticus]|uniref:Cyanophycinase n=1 Tax=Hymenobacter cellulosilyticus TaxID=2932248 RepID=A0A8T9Q507_9BACT|nr:cyanophycinase [Hymenobacter cellulosilyticus]UOQ72766.1 cyanophycinase [Hymenobacter cellulosilyticus]